MVVVFPDPTGPRDVDSGRTLQGPVTHETVGTLTCRQKRDGEWWGAVTYSGSSARFNQSTETALEDIMTANPQPSTHKEEPVFDIPNPDEVTPSTRPDLTNVRFLKNEVTSPFVEVGDYTYFDDEGTRTPFEQANALYLYGPQKLRIGRFTAIAPGVTFLMPGGNHPMVGPSTYPFTMFGGTWAEATLETFLSIRQPGDTVVGNDVWLGREATVMPGVRIGDGAVIAAHSVVTKDVPPYTIVAGNPAREVRTRFDPEDVELLLNIRWWDWPIELITENAAIIMGGTPTELAGIRSEQAHR